MNIVHAYRQRQQVSGLTAEGENLKKRSPVSDDEFNIWLAAVDDYLKSTLPANSSLLARFEKISTSLRGTNEAGSNTDIDTVLGVLRYARFVPGMTTPLPQDGSSDDAAQVQLEREIDAIISERIVHSWAFRIPALILGLTVIFAVFGIIKIQDYEVKLSDIVQQSITKAKQDILSSTEDIQQEISRTASSKLKTLQDDIDAATAVQMQGLAAQFIRGQQMISDTTELRRQELNSQSLKLQDEIKVVARSQIGAIQQQVADVQSTISNTLQVADLPGRISNLEQRLENPIRVTPNIAVENTITSSWIGIVVFLLVIFLVAKGVLGLYRFFHKAGINT